MKTTDQHYKDAREGAKVTVTSVCFVVEWPEQRPPNQVDAVMDLEHLHRRLTDAYVRWLNDA